MLSHFHFEIELHIKRIYNNLLLIIPFSCTIHNRSALAFVYNKRKYVQKFEECQTVSSARPPIVQKKIDFA